MADSQAKKLNLPLYLNPVVSDADRVAMGALQQWYAKANESCSDRSELESVIRVFHHDLYLAGLRLYLLDPRLCRQVAEALEQADLTLEALARQLSACGLWSTGQERTFSADQLQQLEGLLAAMPARAAAGGEAAELTKEAGSSALSQQMSEQREQLTAMQAELHTLRALAEEQAQQLRRLKFAAPPPPAPKTAKAGGAEEMDVSAMTAQIGKMKKVRGKGVF